jgi:hypothetical protein
MMIHYRLWCSAIASGWARVALMSTTAVISIWLVTPPTQPAREIPATLGAARTITTPQGEVNIAPVKVYSTGALLEVRAELPVTPASLLAHPEQVLCPAPTHGPYALTLRTKPTPGGRELTAGTDPPGTPGTRPHHWTLAFWFPRAAWTDTTPHLVWPIAQLDTPLDLTEDILDQAAVAVRPHD